MPDADKTVARIIQAGTEYLQTHSVDSSRLVCELLMSRLLQCRRLELYLQHDRVLSEPQLAAMRRGIKRAASGEPVQYILGEWEFMGHRLRVDKRGLIPRPETEVLVQTVLDCEPLWTDDAPAIADIGTGSGCIVVSLALARERAVFVALDIDEETLQLARENAERHAVSNRIHFAVGELADLVEPESLAAIVANLPYVTTGEVEALAPQVREHEPRVALDGGPDGLVIIRSVVEDAAVALRSQGYLFLEIGETQGRAVSELMVSAGFSEVTVKPDLTGRERIVTGRLNA